MSDEIQLPSLQETPGVQPGGGDLERLESVSVEVAVEIGRTHMTLGDALALAPGSIVTLDRPTDQPVDLLVNGRPIARGEVIAVDDEFGLRVTEIIRPARPGEDAEA
jgi:flagellar motor switch protein FliN/FliY